jgi:UDP-N-acetylmuramoylalanine--D-glutamate ligase
MYSKEWFHGKRITVMGLGLHGGGLGVAKWLLRAGAKLTITDLKSRIELDKSIVALNKEYATLREKRADRLKVWQPRYVLGQHAERDFNTADLVIRNPAVRRNNKYLLLAERRGIPVETEAALFLLLCPFSATVITGTKGKSTVTALLGEIVRRHDSRAVIGGNIRISPFDFLDRLLRVAEKGGRPIPVILELSSWQIEGLEHHRFSPHISIITNLLEDHLNSYSGMADYARAKSLIFAYQTAADWSIINFDDQLVCSMMNGIGLKNASFQGQRFPFSLRVLRGRGCFVRRGKIILRDAGRDHEILSLSDLRLKGEHNVPNVLAACATAYIMGVPVKSIAAAVRNFRGIEGRMQEIATVRGVKYINDTTATMPDAAIASLKAFSAGRGKRIVLIAGGAQKSLHYKDWAQAVKKYAKAVILLEGTETPTLERELQHVGYGGEVWLANSMKHAVVLATNLSERGDIVLLAPACSSFGLFINEFDRGDKFVQAVRKLK